MAMPRAELDIDTLPDDVLQSVLSHLSFAQRLACSTVCKRWHTATLSPPLLDQVAIKAGSAYDDDPGWLATLCSSTAWLLRRAACSVRQLSLEVHTASDTTNIEHAVAAALVQGTLATVAEAGELRELSVVSPNLPVILGSWAASLCHLQRLSIDCFSCPATIDADLSGLTALQSLRLDGCCSHLTPAARLPTTLTSLYLGTNLDDVGEPVNEELPDQVAGLTRLHSLHLYGDAYRSHQFGPLEALGSTLRSLCLDTGISLPDCLPRMLALRTLIITNESCSLHPEEEGGPLHAALARLPCLERLVLDVMQDQPTVLPEGPWQGSLRQLAAPAHILHANLPLLAEAPRLEELGVGSADEPAALGVLCWAAAQQELPLRRLALQLPATERPTVALYDACLAAKGRHPALEIGIGPVQSCKDLLTD